jgi:pyruvate dehydrogenase E2 component (dihydrolipoamide acetyltransferase)
MTLHAIIIPKWGLAMEEGTLSTWLVAEGASLSIGDEIAEIETSKIANVLESQVSGILRRQVAGEGDLRPVGALIGVVADADESDAEIDGFVAEFEARFESEEAEHDMAPVAETVEIEGRPVRYLKVPGGDGIPVVLVHGFGGDHLNWAFNQGAMASGRDAYALDLPGHGGSGKDVGAATLEALAASVSVWMDMVGIETAHLVGHSMGAGVALALALSAPGRVKSLIAICGAGFGGALNADYVEGFLAAERRKDMKPVASMLFANDDLATREMLDNLIAYKRIDGVPEALRALIDNALDPAAIEALGARLGQVSAPILAIYGAADRVIVTPGPDRRPANAIVVDAGHMPHLEAADAVNAHIAAFIAASE